MDDAKRQSLVIALLDFISASNQVAKAVCALRDEEVDGDILQALSQISALFVGTERQDAAQSESAVHRLESAFLQFGCDVSEIALRPALCDLERIKSASSEAKAVLPLVQTLLDGQSSN